MFPGRGCPLRCSPSAEGVFVVLEVAVGEVVAILGMFVLVNGFGEILELDSASVLYSISKESLPAPWV